MPGLVVTFSLDLLAIPCFFAAKGPSTSLIIEGEISNFPVQIELISDKSPSISQSGNTEKKFFFNLLRLTITDTSENLENSEFLQGRARYLLMMTYHPIVILAINRLITYFKYILRNPLPNGVTLIDLIKQEHALYNPEWKTLQGELLYPFEEPITSGILSIPGIGFLQDNLFGIRHFSDDDRSALMGYVFSDTGPTLVDEILSDAQSAALHHNLRRSVLELAIAIEVFVKNMFFKRERIAGSAFEYLEDKGKENIKVIELLDGASLYAFGESFKKHSPSEYRDIDYIFRCRNKIAHRGETKYRDDAGIWKEVDEEMLRTWWNSTLSMFTWLQTKAQTANTLVSDT